MVIAKIAKLPYVGKPKDEGTKTHEVSVTAIPDPVPEPSIIPLWVYVLSAVAGALILLLLIYLLYKVSFRALSVIEDFNEISLSIAVRILQAKPSRNFSRKTATQ